MTVLLLMACLLLAPRHADAQEANVESPRWVAQGGAKLPEKGPVLRLSRSPGFLRTEHYYTDFTLTLEFRLLDDDAVATLSIRVRDSGFRGSRIPITNAGDGTSALARLDTPLGLTSAATFDRDSLAKAKRRPGEWQALRVEATRDSGRVLLNGSLVSTLEQLPEPTGYVTLASERGRVEIRAVGIVRHPFGSDPFGEGALRPDEPGLEVPRALPRSEPYYPDHLRRLAIEGRVRIEAVIERDGSVGDVRVTRGAHRDLNEAAVGSARRWRFQPATKDGVPVPVVVAFELRFELRP